MLYCSRTGRVAMASPGDEDTWRSAPSLQAAETETHSHPTSLEETHLTLDKENNGLSQAANTRPAGHCPTSSSNLSSIQSSNESTSSLPVNLQSSMNNDEMIVTTPVVSLRMIMTSKDVGSIIGKAGMTIKAFREQSGAKINISNGTSSERLVTVTGTKENIGTAFSAITSKIHQDNVSTATNPTPKTDEEEVPGEAAVSFRLIIQTSQCGSLIGRGGSKIKDIRESTSASIQIAGETLPNSTERTVTISGTPEAVTKCIEEICEIIIESPPKGPFVPYKPHSLPNQPYQPRPNLPYQAPYTATFNTAAQPITTTQHMRIPNDLIGCVIGRKGTKIHEIRVNSGAMIKIAGNEGDGSDRLVTITGTPESVGLAQYLINSRIHSEVNSFLLGTV